MTKLRLFWEGLQCKCQSHSMLYWIIHGYSSWLRKKRKKKTLFMDLDWILDAAAIIVHTHTSSSLWFLIPLTKSCMFLSRTLSRFIFIFFSAILGSCYQLTAKAVNLHKNFQLLRKYGWWWMRSCDWPRMSVLLPPLLKFWSCDHICLEIHMETHMIFQAQDLYCKIFDTLSSIWY